MAHHSQEYHYIHSFAALLFAADPECCSELLDNFFTFYGYTVNSFKTFISHQSTV